MTKRLSIHDFVAPLESGGTVARQGFNFQDHVAARFLIEMLSTPELAEVRCEDQDDVTLIWEWQDRCEVEFVQVKNSQPDQLWTVAKLCAKDGESGQAKQSMLEKLLANDRFEEKAYFRVVTSRSIGQELHILAHPLESPKRAVDSPEMIELCDKLNKKTSHTSPNGHGHSYWAAHTRWDVEHSEAALINKNIVNLSDFLERKNRPCELSLAGRLYERLVERAKDAASSNGTTSFEQKRLKRDAFLSWFEALARDAYYHSISGQGKRLIAKLQDANLDESYIDNAVKQRERYRKERLQPTYLQLEDMSVIDSEVAAQLTNLRLELDSGHITDDGFQFHAKCVHALRQLEPKLPGSPTPALVQGSMYNIAARCGHRFRKAPQ